MTETVGLIALSGLGLLACWLDVTRRLLPNWLCLIVAAGGLAFAVFAGGGGQLASHAGHAGIALLVGMGLFAARVIGGGDAKYYAATAGWFALGDGLRLLVDVALAGAVVLAGWIVWRRIKGLKAFPREGGDENKLPYGVAVAIGAVVAFAQLQALNP